MVDMDVVRVSKRLSKVLRHRPETIGITPDANGWVDIDALLVALAEHGLSLTRQDLDEVVSKNDKKRYTIDESGTRIRAAQGHSIEVRLEYPATRPPAVLYHGTPRRNIGSILEHGLDRAAMPCTSRRTSRRRAGSAPGVASSSSSSSMPRRWPATASPFTAPTTGCG